MILNHEAEGYTTTSRHLTAAELFTLRFNP